MSRIWILEDDSDDNPFKGATGLNNVRGKTNQLILSVGLGVTAFFAFCFLRLRWSSLYAARKRQKNEASVLPELPDSVFGWMIPLFRITDQQILASAGLDAYVFLAFFKMAMKFLLVALFFSLTVIQPVHEAVPDDTDDKPGKNETLTLDGGMSFRGNYTFPFDEYFETSYLWMYVVFAYLFTGIAVYLIVSETRRIIDLRQEFLGSQTSVTDRTIRLSGIPIDLQDEERIKEFVENLDIGNVKSVTLCRKWGELDNAVQKRMDTLRRLEEALTIHQGYKRLSRNTASLPISQPEPPSPRPAVLDDGAPSEDSQLIDPNGALHQMPYERARPHVRLRYGRFGFRTRKVDAIDHYSTELKKADEKVIELRKRTFAPTPLAFVTMDSVAACQMAIQAVLDPSPSQLIASQSPSPSDIVWQNTYMPRRWRMIRSWGIATLIFLLTLFWLFLLVPIAVSLSADNLVKVFPQFKYFLKEHKNITALMNTQVPTLLISLLMVLVPYLYYWLSWYQGMISQRDVELSAISKNFFFTFFNFFIIFTILGTASNFYQFYQRFGKDLKDFQTIAFTMAKALQELRDFYINYILLQGVGLFPLRLLEIGSISLYPVYRIGAKTPRDYAELVQPPIFSYAFYLPNALLIFIICMVYSVLRSSWQILLAGLIFFAFGHFVYKYQLLYAMDHRQQASGQAWGMICDRLFLGLAVFQFTTAGQLILKQAVTLSVLMVPLIIITIWIAFLYGKTFKPLLKYIALRSVKRGEQYTDQETPVDSNSGVMSPPGRAPSSEFDPERNVWADGDSSRSQRVEEPATQQDGRMFDESDETFNRYVNPSLVVPLEKVWIANQNYNHWDGRENGEVDELGENALGEEAV